MRGGAPQVDPQSLGEHAVMAIGKALQISQVLVMAQDSQHRHQQQVPRRNAHPAPLMGIRHRLQDTDQIKAGVG